MKVLRFAFLCFLLTFRLDGAELKVVAPRSVAHVVTEISHFFDQQHPDSKISLRFENSLRAVRLLELGTPTDVVILSDEKLLQRVRDKSLISKTSEVRLASNELVIVAPATSKLVVKEPKNLIFPELKKVALYPESSAVQVKVRTYLTKVGLLQSVTDKKMEVKDSGAAFEALSKGEADWAFVYSSEATAKSGVKVIWRVPPADIPPVVFYAAVVESSPQKALAGQFVGSMQSTISQKIFENSGFSLTPSGVAVTAQKPVPEQPQTQKTKKPKPEKKAKKPTKGKENQTQTAPKSP